MPDESDSILESAGAASSEDDLSAAELQDLAVAAVAASELEAIALEDKLEDAGIPVCTRGGTTNGVNSLGIPQPVQVMVPRKMLLAAQEAIEQFRGENSRDSEVVRPEDKRYVRRQLQQGIALLGLGTLVFAASFFLPANDTGRITIVFGVPTMITGLCVAIMAKHKLDQRRKK